jgi:hypothetical protein
MCHIPHRPRGVFAIQNKAVQKKVNGLDLFTLKTFLEGNMSFANSLRQFPIVKVVPLKAFDRENERPGEAALRGMVINAIVSLRDVETVWKIDHDATDLRDKFQKLYYQLDSLRKYCEGSEKDT